MLRETLLDRLDTDCVQFDPDVVGSYSQDRAIFESHGEAAVLVMPRNTADVVTSTYQAVARVAARGGTLKDAMQACRDACDPKFGDYAIYEHCLPFNVARAYDEARDIDTPRIWTAARDKEMWAALQG